MRAPTSPLLVPRLERWLAVLLQYGTWLGALVMAAGLALGVGATAAHPGHLAGIAVTAGVAIIIVLPVVRLVVMLAVYCAERDWRLAALAALVLLIVLAGCLAGLKLGPLAA